MNLNMKRRYFEVWGNEEAQNVFLKGLLSIISVLFIAQSVALVMIGTRKPLLVAVGQTDTRVFTLAPPSQELLNSELKRWAKQYAETHYNWDYKSIEKAHAEAAKYVSEKFVKAFLSANSEQVKLAHEKKISERVYLSAEIEVDVSSLSARISMDRIFTVEGLRATSPLTLDIQFEFGPRTQQNPEGIYVISEKIVAPKNGG